MSLKTSTLRPMLAPVGQCNEWRTSRITIDTSDDLDAQGIAARISVIVSGYNNAVDGDTPTRTKAGEVEIVLEQPIGSAGTATAMLATGCGAILSAVGIDPAGYKPDQLAGAIYMGIRSAADAQIKASGIAPSDAK